MAIGLGLLHLAPRDFWSMSLRELEAAIEGLHGPAERLAPLRRAEFERLMQQFPDHSERIRPCMTKSPV